VVFRGIFFRRLIGPGQMTRHNSLCPNHLIDRFTRIRIDDAVRRQTKSVGLDEGLGQIDRVGNHVDVRQQIAMTDEALFHRGAIAQRQAVAPHPSDLEVCGANDEHGPFPASG
jgi:hypothetical protein